MVGPKRAQASHDHQTSMAGSYLARPTVRRGLSPGYSPSEHPHAGAWEKKNLDGVEDAIEQAVSGSARGTCKNKASPHSEARYRSSRGTEPRADFAHHSHGLKMGPLHEEIDGPNGWEISIGRWEAGWMLCGPARGGRYDHPTLSRWKRSARVPVESFPLLEQPDLLRARRAQRQPPRRQRGVPSRLEQAPAEVFRRVIAITHDRTSSTTLRNGSPEVGPAGRLYPYRGANYSTYLEKKAARLEVQPASRTPSSPSASPGELEVGGQSNAEARRQAQVKGTPTPLS